MTIVAHLDAPISPHPKEVDGEGAAAREPLPSHGGLRVEWRPLAAMQPFVAEWKELADRAIAPNVFYDPAFALPAAPLFGADAVAGLVWSIASPRLVGFFPARLRRWRYGFPLPMLTGWTHPYAPLGTPLVDRDHAEGAIAAWLDEIRHNATLPALVMLPLLPETGAFAAAFDRVLGSGARPVARFGRHQRALFAPGADRGSYLEQAMGPKRRRDLRRQLRRLQDVGVTIVETASFPTASVAALDGYFTLEASGRKDRARAAADPQTRRFIEQAVAALAADNQARVDRLLVGEKVIAVSVILRSGATGFLWRLAYDEGAARFSPGIQLLHAVTGLLLEEPAWTRVDSCAAPDHPTIEHLWRERLALSDRLVLAKPHAATAFRLACRAETLRRKLAGGLKKKMPG
jgi:hypothetical protein